MTLEKTVLSLEEIGEHVTSLSTDPGFLGMLAEDFITDVMSGNVDRLYDMVATFAVAVNPLEYAAVVVDGEVVDYRNGKGVEVEPTDVRMPSAGSYEVISDLSSSLSAVNS
jgi:transposase-like protein